MEVNFWLVSLPALFSLFLKAGIYTYAHYSRAHSYQTRLYLLTLFAFSIQNIGEIAHFYSFIERGVMPSSEVTLFYAATIVALAFLVHLVLSLAFDPQRRLVRVWSSAIYLYALVLEGLLLFTPLMVAGYTPIGHSVTRIPGPYYGLFEIYVLGICASVVGILIYGSVRQDSPSKRSRAKIALLGIMPLIIVAVSVILALHAGIRLFNAAVTMPIAITFFLAVTAYATHQHRIFDIQFYIPWSKVRKRKTAFYDRIRSMIAEIADLGSVNQAVERLADTLRCPVAFMDDSRTLIAAAGAPQMAKMPLPMLRNIDQIVVANEIADAMPDTHAAMKQHGVAAVVPFYPHSKSAASWLLLGDSFSENVYTPLDFRMVEELFDKMAEQFLDKLLAMRMQLAEAQNQIQTLKSQLQTTESSLFSVQQKIEALAQENTRLQREQPADSLAAVDRAPIPFTITLLGRDKETQRRLRQQFAHAEYYSGADSSSFRRHPAPDILVVRIEVDTDTNERRLLQVLTGSHRKCATLFYGARAQGFVADYRRELVGLLTEVLPQSFTDELLARKVRALAELYRVTYAVNDADHPLIGQSIVLKEALAEAKRLAGFKEPVFIQTENAEEAVAVAKYIHDASGAEGACAVLHTTHGDFEDTRGRLGALLKSAHHGSFVIDNIGALPNELWEQLLSGSNQFADCRLVVGSTTAETRLDPAVVMRPLRPFVLQLPTLRERRGDIAALVHYFTLQFNLQSGTNRYLTQAEIDEWLASAYPKNLLELKAAVFLRLMAKEKSDVAEPIAEFNAQGKTLDECVTEFEARLIVDTLKRCGGNKSKAARLLGMRPNTLHYKLERYGLDEKKG